MRQNRYQQCRTVEISNAKLLYQEKKFCKRKISISSTWLGLGDYFRRNLHFHLVLNKTRHTSQYVYMQLTHLLKTLPILKNTSFFCFFLSKEPVDTDRKTAAGKVNSERAPKWRSLGMGLWVLGVRKCHPQPSEKICENIGTNLCNLVHFGSELRCYVKCTT